MSIFEYNKEEEERKLRKAEFEAGVAEGIEKGIEQGEIRKAKEMALILKKMGLSIEEIAHAVNVNKATIRKWLKLQEVAD